MIKDPRGADLGILSFHSQFIIMARIKLGPIVTNISGSVGGMTFQRNKFGISLRQKPLPLKSQTSAQYVIRQHIVTIQSAWQALTDSQRLQWSRFIDFSGQSIKRDKSVKLSGHGLYIKYQLLLLLMGKSLLSTIVYSPLPATPAFENIKTTAGNLLFRFDDTWDDANVFFILQMSSPRLPAKRFSLKGLRWIYVQDITASQFQINDPYVSAFGLIPSVGDTVHFTIQAVSLVSPVFSTPVQYVTALLAI